MKDELDTLIQEILLITGKQRGKRQHEAIKMLAMKMYKDGYDNGTHQYPVIET